MFMHIASASLKERQVAIIFNDISQYKRAEETLRRQADLLRLSFDAILRLATGWRNRELERLGTERLYGFSESEALGRVCSRVAQDRSSRAVAFSSMRSCAKKALLGW